MRYLFRIGGFGLLLWSSTLWAQGNNNLPIIAPPASNGGGSSMWGWQVANSTPAGSYLQGLASVVRAQGDYNLSTSAAAVNWTTAYRQSIQNEKDYVEAYFAIRALNRQAREAEYAKERQSTEDWLRYHPSVKPKRLTTSELDPISGTIFWPMLLQADELSDARQNIQKAYLKRHQLGVMDHNNYRMVQQLANNLLDEILGKIQSLAPSEYMQAKKFIEALIYEASLPMG
jgi:hypothetical protein